MLPAAPDQKKKVAVNQLFFFPGGGKQNYHPREMATDLVPFLAFYYVAPEVGPLKTCVATLPLFFENPLKLLLLLLVRNGDRQEVTNDLPTHTHTHPHKRPLI